MSSIKKTALDVQRWLKYKYMQLMRAQGGPVHGSTGIFDRHCSLKCSLCRPTGLRFSYISV